MWIGSVVLVKMEMELLSFRKDIREYRCWYKRYRMRSVPRKMNGNTEEGTKV